jgi:membrane protein required for colicin V production
LFAGGLLAWLLKKLVESVGLRPMDRVLGGGFGLLRGAVILMVMGVVAVMTGLNRSDAWTSAIGARWIDGAVAVCAPILLPDGVLSLMQETPGNPHPAKP